MWALLSARFRMWLLFAIGVPIVAWAMGKVADRMEARSGPSRLTRGLRSGRERLRSQARGPAARRRGRA